MVKTFANTKPVVKNSQWLLKFLNFFIWTTCVCAGLFYLLTINDLTIKGFSLQSLKVQANILDDEQKDLKLQVSNLQSYNNLIVKAVELNMVEVSEVDYLQSNSEVAKK